MITPGKKIVLYRSMLRIRLVEERIASVYAEQQMRCPVHLSIGQEAAASGVCEALEKEDMVYSTHRCHGHYIAKGGSLEKMMGEIYGRDSGCIRGLGGSMHLMDLSCGFMPTIPIVGGAIPVAAGTALANLYKKNSVVTVSFFGDAAVEEGAFHESVNFAVLKKLPILFFCENNKYSVYTPLRTRQPRESVASLVGGHGLPSRTIDGNDVVEVYEATRTALDFIRAGGGPVFIEAMTYRWREHCGPNYDNHLGYRSEEEFLRWKELCPVEKMKNRILNEGIISQSQLNEIYNEELREINSAIEFGKTSPFPSIEVMSDYVYAK